MSEGGSQRPHAPPRAPYFLRAMHAWITDAELTPQIIVNTRVEGVRVPVGYSDEHGRIVLNIAYEAVRDLELRNAAVSFNARFGGVPHALYVPMNAILGIYARETGEGMVFDEGAAMAGPGGTADTDSSAAASSPDDEAPKPKPKPKPALKIIK